MTIRVDNLNSHFSFKYLYLYKVISMALIFTILLTLSDIPQELYSSYCSKDVIDSVYTECHQMAINDYPDNVDAGTDYYVADWAYGVSLLDLSKLCLDEALRTTSPETVLHADCLSLASAVSRLKGDLAAAISYAEECLAIDRKNGNKEYISSSLNNIAGLYMTHGEAGIAKKYIDEAIELEKKLERSPYLAIRYGVASEIYLKLGDTKQALDFADAALQLDSIDGRWDKVAVRRSQKSGILMETGHDSQARKELELAIPIFREGNNLNSLAISLAQLGEIAFKAGDVCAAEKAYDECLDICIKTKNIYIESRVRKDLWQMYRDYHHEMGLMHLERYMDLQNQLNSGKATELMQSFNVKYETLKKEQTIALQRNRIIYISIVLILFIALAAASVFIALLKNKAAKALEEKNALLVKANLDKDRLLAIAKANIPKKITEEILSITSSTDVMPDVKLTKREMQIAELCASGMLNKEIADKLNISQRTVEAHKNNIYRKLGINNTIELMHYIQKVFTDKKSI